VVFPPPSNFFFLTFQFPVPQPRTQVFLALFHHGGHGDTIPPNFFPFFRRVFLPLCNKCCPPFGPRLVSSFSFADIFFLLKVLRSSGSYVSPYWTVGSSIPSFRVSFFLLIGPFPSLAASNLSLFLPATFLLLSHAFASFTRLFGHV